MDHLLLLFELIHMGGDRTMLVMLDERVEERNLHDKSGFFAGQFTA